MTSELFHRIPSINRRRPALTPLQAVPSTDDDNKSTNDDDIYRGGGRPPSVVPPSPTGTQSSSSSSSLSSSSSSSSFQPGGPLGALASVVEQAITRWARGARGRSSSSSSSSSSASSKSSKLTLSRPSFTRRRRSSMSSLRTITSERDIVARITRMKALEESRQIPRQFVLYLPPSLGPAHSSRHAPRDLDNDPGSRSVIQTTSLSLTLVRLGAALKRATKVQRHLDKNYPGVLRPSQYPISKPLRYSASGTSHGQSSSRTFPRRGGKGKQRERADINRRHRQFAKPNSTKAWFLDVASPTWEDLRAIGKLLHLHPLTLEDILQQDPREKLDLFPKLGYYFISFRAIETRQGREKSQRQFQKLNEYRDSTTMSQGEGPLGESNVYLVVFNEGICCFHYNDIAEHTDRIHSRITLREEVASLSSDWIAHGILDSIVDSFFPYLEEIGKEVMAIEELVFAPTVVDESAVPITQSKLPPTSPSAPQRIQEKEPASKPSLSALEKISFDEKSPSIGKNVRPRFAAPRWTIPLAFRRIRRFFAKHLRRMSTSSEAPPSATTLTLRRMARARRLVTSLNRLLASKSEVITQIRKRLLKAGASGLGNGTKSDELEVAIYMGDVQDHILTLQHSLNHYERMLSQSHPVYLSQLRTMFATTKSGTDKSLIYLTTISIAVLCIQTVIGSCSMNVKVPRSDTTFVAFGIVLCLAVLVLFAYLQVVRYWWNQAGKRRRALL